MARITIEHDIPMPEFAEYEASYKYPCILRQVGERFIDWGGCEVIVTKRTMKKKHVVFQLKHTS